jgi:hypothetical protein
MKRRAGRNDDTPHCSTSEADYDSDTDGRSSLDVNQHVQLGSIRTDGECTNKQVDIDFKLSDKFRILLKDSEYLNIRVEQSLFLSVVAECPLLHLQSDMKLHHLLLKPTKPDPIGMY